MKSLPGRSYTEHKVSEAEDCLTCLISISEELKGGQCGRRGENEGEVARDKLRKHMRLDFVEPLSQH